MRRGLTVLKMRGSPHDKEIREFIIDGHGMHVGEAFRNVAGIISGSPVQLTLPPEEVRRFRAALLEQE
jgi:circadian clock protein KaiC